MPELPKTVEEAIEIAISAELDANANYLYLAQITQNPDAKILFQNLARDEQWHKETLEERYRAMTGNKEPNPVAASIEGAVVRREAKKTMDEMLILHLAIAAEISAFDFYTLAAEMTDEIKINETFLRLAQDEKRHRELLEKEVQGRQGKPTDEFELDNWVKE